MNSNEEIIPSYVLEWINKKLVEFEKRLDKYDEFLSSYTTPAISYHEQPSWHVATDVAQPRPPPYPPNGQPGTLQQPPHYQSSYSPNMLPRNPYTGYHSEQPEYQPIQPMYQLPRSPYCWDPPVLRTEQGYPPYDLSLPRLPTYCDSPEQLTTQEYQAYDQQPPTCWALPSPQRLTPNQDRHASCPITEVESFLLGSIQSSVCGSKHGMREQEGEVSDSSSLDVQIKYSCDGARVVDCVHDRGKGEVELGESKVLILETTTKKSMDYDADYSDTRSVSNIVLCLPSENCGSWERSDGSPKGQQVSPFGEIYTPGILDMSEEEVLFDVEEIAKALYFNDSQRQAIKDDKKSTDVGEKNVLIFDPGGFSTLIVASWFPP